MRRVSRTAAILLATLSFAHLSVADAQVADVYPVAGTKAEQWKYITKLAAQGFEIKRTEAQLTGVDRTKAFRKRTSRFYWAADSLRDYVEQHFTSDAQRRSGSYVYAVFTAGLYWENSGDPWRARAWYHETEKYLSLLTQQGSGIPKYNGSPVSALLPARVARVTQLASLSGGVHPVSYSLQFDAGNEHADAVNFLLDHETQAGALFGPEAADAPQESIDKGTAP